MTTVSVNWQPKSTKHRKMTWGGNTQKTKQSKTKRHSFCCCSVYRLFVMHCECVRLFTLFPPYLLLSRILLPLLNSSMQIIMVASPTRHIPNNRGGEMDLRVERRKRVKEYYRKRRPIKAATSFTPSSFRTKLERLYLYRVFAAPGILSRMQYMHCVLLWKSISEVWYSIWRFLSSSLSFLPLIWKSWKYLSATMKTFCPEWDLKHSRVTFIQFPFCRRKYKERNHYHHVSLLSYMYSSIVFLLFIQSKLRK